MTSRPLAIAAVALVCAAAGFLAYRQWHAVPALEAAATAASTAPEPTATAAAEASAPTAESATAAGSKPAVPERVPDIQLHDIDGKLRRLKEFSGQPTIINFWATWCVPCRREIPLLNELRRSHDPAKLQIVGIAVDFRDAVLEYLKTTKLDYALLIGEQDGVDAAARFGMELVLPFSIFVDGQDRIVAVKVGELHREEATAILSAIDELAAGRKDLPAVRQGIAAELRRLSAERALKAGPAGS